MTDKLVRDSFESGIIAADRIAPDQLAVVPDSLIIVVGGDALAMRVCEELTDVSGQRVAVVWHQDDGISSKIERSGARFVRDAPIDDETLIEAGVREAEGIIALTDDDQLNLQITLRARDLNPKIRIVMRQFNRTLGRKIEQNLRDSSVVSLSSHAAATYASAALDPSCYYGLQFPDIDGPMTCFSVRLAHDLGVGGKRLDEAERECDLRILAVGRSHDVPPDRVLDDGDELVVFSRLRPIERVLSGERKMLAKATDIAPRAFRRVAGVFRDLDIVVRRVIFVSLAIFLAGTIYFGVTLHLDPITAIYFVMATMTTTGYGDITPRESDKISEIASMVLMLSGITFSGIFIAVLTAKFAEAQFRETQGLRRVRLRGHVVICGAGNVGSRVIDFLLAMGTPIVAIEVNPTPEIIARARNRGFLLMTGDATNDTVLDLCNLGEAEAVIALTHNDTRNLEIALGARARNERMPVVMRVQGDTFAQSVSRHFKLYRTHGTAALTGPVFAGRSRFKGIRGRVAIAGREYMIGEYQEGVDEPPFASPDTRALAIYRDNNVCGISDFAEAKRGDRVLFLFPVWMYRRNGAREHALPFETPLPPHDHPSARVTAMRMEP